jgi:hypothetical protein
VSYVLDSTARDIWHLYSTSPAGPRTPWELLKPEVQDEFRAYARDVLDRVKRFDPARESARSLRDVAPAGWEVSP